MPPTPRRADQFRYEGFEIDESRGVVQCTYATAGHRFTEQFEFGPAGHWDDPAVGQAIRLLYLLAAVSYYKTTAALHIDLGNTPTTGAERAFLRQYYLEGLGEFAYRNGLELSDLTIDGPEAEPAPASYQPRPMTPLIPFGGGIDSIVTVESIRANGPEPTLFVLHPPDQRFAAIEEPAAVTGLPVVRVARQLDAAVRQSEDHGFFNGHIPVTAVVTAAAVVAAVLGGHDAVVMSNEWSASVPTLVNQGRAVNHQWSKGEEFEVALAAEVAATLGSGLSVFSYLRPRSELWVAEQFAQLAPFHRVFRSCNRAFHQDVAQRLGQWCGLCDKCCFIDLILAPFMPAADLAAVFDDREPLANPENLPRFAALVGVDREAKPFECVGDVNECRSALSLTAERDDRRRNELIGQLRDLVANASRPDASPSDLLAPIGPHYIPKRYAPRDLLARSG
ncbi:MAG TPA: hypothetical protein VGG38_04340 [Acidimicrobiales bacterium]|jgi:hypothetical protein